jgi:hypothetical protein
MLRRDPRSEESVGQRVGVEEPPILAREELISSCAHRERRGAIGDHTSWSLLRYCVTAARQLGFHGAGEHRGPVPGYSLAPPDGRALEACGANHQTQSCSIVRRHRRELIGKRERDGVGTPDLGAPRVRGALAKTEFLKAEPREAKKAAGRERGSLCLGGCATHFLE